MMRTIGEESGACSAIQFKRFQFAETVASGQNMAALQLYSSDKQKRVSKNAPPTIWLPENRETEIKSEIIEI